MARGGTCTNNFSVTLYVPRVLLAYGWHHEKKMQVKTKSSLICVLCSRCCIGSRLEINNIY